MLSCSDIYPGQGLWLKGVRYPGQEGLFHPLGLTACSTAVAQIMFSGVRSPRKLSVSWKVWPALLGQRGDAHSSSAPALSPFPLSFFLHPSLLPFLSPSSSFHLQTFSPLGPNVIQLLLVCSSVSVTWLFLHMDMIEWLAHSLSFVIPTRPSGNGSGQKPV